MLTIQVTYFLPNPHRRHTRNWSCIIIINNLYWQFILMLACLFLLLILQKIPGRNRARYRGHVSTVFPPRRSCLIFVHVGGTDTTFWVLFWCVIGTFLHQFLWIFFLCIFLLISVVRWRSSRQPMHEKVLCCYFLTFILSSDISLVLPAARNILLKGEEFMVFLLLLLLFTIVCVHNDARKGEGHDAVRRTHKVRQ